MTSIWLWLSVLVAGVVAISYAATIGQTAHLLVAASVSAVFVVLALVDRSRRVGRGSSEPALAGATASSMALVWAWAGLSMLVTYQLFLSWHEWWQYVLAGVGVAALSLGFAWMMSKDDAAGRRDETMLNIARYLTIGQFVGMLVAIVGMIIDGKMPRDPSEPDWAANGIFFFGAVALAVISANALWGPAARRA